jgi:hypothetical protein
MIRHEIYGGLKLDLIMWRLTDPIRGWSQKFAQSWSASSLAQLGQQKNSCMYEGAEGL